MPDFGFIHPNGNYFQAEGDTVEDLMPKLPEGTVNVPLQPSPEYVWDGTQWVLGQLTGEALDLQITSAPDDLFGGPTLGEIFNGD